MEISTIGQHKATFQQFKNQANNTKKVQEILKKPKNFGWSEQYKLCNNLTKLTTSKKFKESKKAQKFWIKRSIKALQQLKN